VWGQMPVLQEIFKGTDMEFNMYLFDY
jgi:hypothetical protein